MTETNVQDTLPQSNNPPQVELPDNNWLAIAQGDALPVPSKQVRMPSLNALGNLVAHVEDPQTYVTALHALMGDHPNAQPESPTNVACKALGLAVPQAYSFANFSFMPDAGNWGLLQWPGINPESLRKICRENAPPKIVISGRRGDMLRYAGLSTKPWMPGWRIELKDARDTPTAKQRQDIKDAEKLILMGSMDYDYTEARERDAKLLSPWHMIMQRFADDIHTFDGWALWTQYDRMGRPIAFTDLPAGLIRLALPTQGLKGDKRLFAALIDQTGNPVRCFTRRELIWSIMNPRSDPASFGYGWPIPEQAIQMAQAMQAGIELNTSTFTKSAIPNGMLLGIGDFWSQENIDALQREWVNMKKGISKMWGLPIMSVPEKGDLKLLNFMDLKGEDIRYKDHMNLMLGLYCFLSQFPVSRTGMFASGNRKDNHPVPDESMQIQGTDDSGLPMHLEFIENRVNPYLIWPNWPHLVFRFLNKNPKEDARSYQERTKCRTWGESRAENDEKPLTSIVPKEMKPLAEVLELCPEDPAKMGVFQTLAAQWLEATLPQPEAAATAGGVDKPQAGAPFPSLKDPARTEAHGHVAGVRRDASKVRAQEKQRNTQDKVS